MKVLLPSRGILGQTKVNVRIPTFGDLHKIQEYNDDDLLRKYEFVHMLSDVNFSKVTPMDMEYLFTVVAFSLMFNNIKYDKVCPHCSKKFKHTVSILEQDIKQLSISKSDLPYSTRINLKKYSYTLLSAQQLIDAYDWAQYEDNESAAFDDAKVAFIMGKQLSDVEWVRRLPVSIYLGALLFQKLNYHGLDYTVNTVCPFCGKKVDFRFVVSSQILKFDIDTMMSRYVSVAQYSSLSDFMKMSIVDFNAFVSALNRSLNK